MTPATPTMLEHRRPATLDKLKLEMAAAPARLRMMELTTTHGHNTMLARYPMSCHPCGALRLSYNATWLSEAREAGSESGWRWVSSPSSTSSGSRGHDTKPSAFTTHTHLTHGGEDTQEAGGAHGGPGPDPA